MGVTVFKLAFFFLGEKSHFDRHKRDDDDDDGTLSIYHFSPRDSPSFPRAECQLPRISSHTRNKRSIHTAGYKLYFKLVQCGGVHSI